MRTKATDRERRSWFSYTRAFNDDGTLTILASTENTDRHGEVVEADAFGPNAATYRANPVILAAHDHWLLSGEAPVIANSVEERIIPGQGLEQRLRFIPSELYPPNTVQLGPLYEALYLHKFMHAFSIGFIPGEIERTEDGPLRHVLIDHLETSAVVVPSNRESLVRCADEGGAGSRLAKWCALNLRGEFKPGLWTGENAGQNVLALRGAVGALRAAIGEAMEARAEIIAAQRDGYTQEDADERPADVRLGLRTPAVHADNTIEGEEDEEETDSEDPADEASEPSPEPTEDEPADEASEPDPEPAPEAPEDAADPDAEPAEEPAEDAEDPDDEPEPTPEDEAAEAEEEENDERMVRLLPPATPGGPALKQIADEAVSETDSDVLIQIAPSDTNYADGVREIVLVPGDMQVFATIGMVEGADRESITFLRFPKGEDWTRANARAWASEADLDAFLLEALGEDGESITAESDDEEEESSDDKGAAPIVPTLQLQIDAGGLERAEAAARSMQDAAERGESALAAMEAIVVRAERAMKQPTPITETNPASGDSDAKGIAADESAVSEVLRSLDRTQRAVESAVASTRNGKA